MSDKPTNRKDPLTLLIELGDTAEAVALQLEQLGIRGTFNSRSCPLVHYLEAQGYNHVQISPYHFQYDDYQDILPLAACAFVRCFDAGHFPKLIRRTNE